MRAFLDGLPVETRWLSGHHIVWQTGQQNGPDGVGPDAHTHCSAFVAAVALDLDIYILRPPHHPQQLLANAQMDWLGGAAFPGPSARGAGWHPLGRSSDPGILASAVTAANAGKLVVAGYRQPPTGDPTAGRFSNRPGHVVVLRPQPDLSPGPDGPLVVSVGGQNFRTVAMRQAFASHRGAWPDQIALHVHDTDLEQSFGAQAGLG